VVSGVEHAGGTAGDVFSLGDFLPFFLERLKVDRELPGDAALIERKRPYYTRCLSENRKREPRPKTMLEPLSNTWNHR
jgi:hypothetical protein